MDLRALIFMPALAAAAICAFVFFTFAAHYYLTILESTGAGAKEVFMAAALSGGERVGWGKVGWAWLPWGEHAASVRNRVGIRTRVARMGSPVAKTSAGSLLSFPAQ